MFRDEVRMEMLEEFSLIHISFGGLLRTQNRKLVREEFYLSVEVWMDWSEWRVVEWLINLCCGVGLEKVYERVMGEIIW